MVDFRGKPISLNSIKKIGVFAQSMLAH